ncbi:MAG: radical SAM protein [bacterium]
MIDNQKLRKNLPKLQLALISPASNGLKMNLDHIYLVSQEKIAEKIPSQYLFSPFSRWSGMGLGLLIISALTPDIFQIDLIDENIKDIDFNKKYDLIAISLITQQAPRAYIIADSFRAKGIPVILGGIHPTIMKDEAKAHADSIIIGEAEELWTTVIEDFLNKDLKSIYYSNDSVDLSKSPIPRYDLLDFSKYKIAWIQTTRGCPHGCEFCAASNIFGKRYRHKSIQQVINEVQYIKRLTNIQIGFADDNMFVNREFSYTLLKELKKLNINWITQTDISVGEDDELLELLRKSGCNSLFIGFESLSKRNLTSDDRENWKLKYIDNYATLIKNIQSYGIGVLGAFILGFDEDEESTFNELAEFIISNNLYASQLTILTPLPGTRLRERLLRENRVISSDWNRYTFLDVNFIPKRMSPQRLQEGLYEVFQKVYDREVRIKVAQHFKKIYHDLRHDPGEKVQKSRK